MGLCELSINPFNYFTKFVSISACISATLSKRGCDYLAFLNFVQNLDLFCVAVLSLNYWAQV